ncbi:MAG: hypothetical protein NVS9B8_18220 [Candidatus Limnocylindrales bacterium]
MCNVPVYLWLSGADEVPVRQVRRAMLTWRSKTADLSWEHGSRQADLAAERLAGRRLRDGERNRVALPIAEGAFTGRLDVEYLFDGVADVIGRDRAGPIAREADDLMRGDRSGRLAMADLGDDQYLRARRRVSSVWLAAAGANGPAQHGAKVPSRAGTACLVLATELGAEIDPSVEH